MIGAPSTPRPIRWQSSRGTDQLRDGHRGLVAGGSADAARGSLVAVVAEELDEPTRTRLVALHRDLCRTDPTAGELHCVYVPRRDVRDVVLEARWREPLVSLLDRRAAQPTPDLLAGGGRFRPGR